VHYLTSKFEELQAISGGNLSFDDVGINSENSITYDFTFIDKNIEYKREVFKVITETFEEKVKQYLADYKPIIANYIRKKTGNGEVPLHQNWAFADEKKCCTVSIWCPLVDSFKQNGTLQVTPGSHKKFGYVRGPMIPWELDAIKDVIINEYMVPLEIPAGHAVILDDSIVHYSSANHTDALRLAIQLILIPSEFPSIHYHMNPAASQEHVDVLEVDEEFYMQFNPWKQPENQKILSSFKHQTSMLDRATFEKRLKGERLDGYDKQGFFQKIKQLIS
jgi:hypothetical protein